LAHLVSPQLPSPDDDLLRPREVAELFGVRTTTIARWAREGVLIAVTTPGGHRRYRRSEIITALEQTSGSTGQQRIEDAVRPYDQGWPIRRVVRSELWGDAPASRGEHPD
jgi:excisionase family DNA binding protein